MHIVHNWTCGLVLMCKCILNDYIFTGFLNVCLISCAQKRASWIIMVGEVTWEIPRLLCCKVFFKDADYMQTSNTTVGIKK